MLFLVVDDESPDGTGRLVRQFAGGCSVLSSTPVSVGYGLGTSSRPTDTL